MSVGQISNTRPHGLRGWAQCKPKHGAAPSPFHEESPIQDNQSFCNFVFLTHSFKRDYNLKKISSLKKEKAYHSS